MTGSGCGKVRPAIIPFLASGQLMSMLSKAFPLTFVRGGSRLREEARLLRQDTPGDCAGARRDLFDFTSVTRQFPARFAPPRRRAIAPLPPATRQEKQPTP